MALTRMSLTFGLFCSDLTKSIDFFFFKQKTAYEISTYWSSDVCSSDLRPQFQDQRQRLDLRRRPRRRQTRERPHRGQLRIPGRSEERRVGKECRSRGSPYH